MTYRTSELCTMIYLGMSKKEKTKTKKITKIQKMYSNNIKNTGKHDFDHKNAGGYDILGI